MVMKWIIEKIRKFWKREKDDIKRNYVISSCVHDFDSGTLGCMFGGDGFRSVYIVYGIGNGDISDYMIGFSEFGDAERYLKNMRNHFYGMGYRHVGIRRCSVMDSL